jgi:hypothetical protein
MFVIVTLRLHLNFWLYICKFPLDTNILTASVNRTEANESNSDRLEREFGHRRTGEFGDIAD